MGGSYGERASIRRMAGARSLDGRVLTSAVRLGLWASADGEPGGQVPADAPEGDWPSPRVRLCWFLSAGFGVLVGGC